MINVFFLDIRFHYFPQSLSMLLLLVALLPVLTSSEVTECNAPRRNQTESCYGKDCYNGYCQDIDYDVGNFKYGHCICDTGWTGFDCRDCCDLPCEKGTCDFLNDDKTRPFCNCENGFTGEHCNEIAKTNAPPTSPPSTVIPDYYWYLIGAGVFLLLLLVTIGIGLIICLYRKRYYFIMRIVYKLQKFEDDDGREYDAFISYRSSHQEDRHFVVYKLFPKLEQEFGFKLCIDQRDFIPGAVIADNIIEAIQNSRRTILILSPKFCDSEWTQFEYQRAQLESISKHHRIIPIMFKDISQVANLDKNLEHIIKSITYLVWPGEDADEKDINKFWSKLKLSMPKLKESDVDLPFTAQNLPHYV